jgi:hypothetical protein
VGALALQQLGPHQRAALLRAIALVPGIRPEGLAHVVTGRVGVVFGARLGPLRSDVIIDRGTGAVIGTRTVVIDPHALGLPAGTISEETIVRISLPKRKAKR